MLHPAFFSEHYQPRFVNTLYLDSANLENYFDNINGQHERVKVRIRWYGNLFGFVAKPILELKFKNGFLGRKESFPLVPFSIDEDFQVDTIKHTLKESKIPNLIRLDLLAAEPSIVSRYWRRYFVSADKKYRLTVDSELIFYQLAARSNSFLHQSADLVNTVVELKYDAEHDRHANQVANHFPFRITKSSKYVSGVERLYLW